MAQEKTPGVYINEINAFPNSVVEVATAVPAFIGYTERARRGTQDLTGVPTRITSMSEFETLFGGPPATRFTFAVKEAKPVLSPVAASRFLLHASMRLFFDNGGGPCWIVSIGGYGDADNPVAKTAKVFMDALEPLKEEQEPTMILTPDTVLLDRAGHAEVANAAINHCAEMQSRVAILDIHDGFKARTLGDDDIISGSQGFRTLVNPDRPSYGVVYYPWVNTSIVEQSALDYCRIEEADRPALVTYLTEALAARTAPDAPTPEAIALIGKVNENCIDPTEVTRTRNALMTISPAYKDLMGDMLAQLNLLPPSAAMAGVYTRTDNNIGVWKAPANTGIASVLSPAVTISSNAQEDLNVPLQGKAINAIRTFMGRGVLVWGARTLDGNSQDWRYINVRRTMIMLEQSIKFAAEAYVFAPNDASTWTTVKTMLENFLNNQWKAGALAGATPEDAYDVSVGLGSTMTGNDILDGYMRIAVKVAVTRPAEFIVITFQQKMQTN